ncbi:MAG TPA: histidine kinase [Hanamia sp.]
MLIRYVYLAIRRYLLQIALILLTALTLMDASFAQDKMAGNSLNFFPRGYYKLNTMADKMRFLENAINDSLDEDQLTHVLDWARVGLKMAEISNVDTMKGIFNFFIAKAYAYEYTKPDSAIVYYKKVLPYFPDKMRKYHVYSVREIMERYADMGNKDSSLVYLDSLKALIDTMPVSSPKRASLSQNIATTYQWFGMFNTAIHYFQIAVNGERKNGNNRGLGLALANLGELYSESEDDVKALQYSKEALVYLADVNMPYIMTATNVATYFTSLKQYDSALFYLTKSENRARLINDANNLLLIRLALAGIYLGQKKYDLARPLLENCEVNLTKSGDRWNLTRTFISLANLDTSEQHYQKAINNLLKGLQVAKEDKQQTLEVIILQNLAEVSAKMKNYEAAFNYQKQYLAEKDSLTGQKTKASLADLEISYQTLEKEKMIKDLQAENNIKRLELINSSQTFYFYLAGFITLLLISGIVFYQRSHRIKLKTEKMKAELQTRVLRSQMNPHFIFNCLNSIENFIMLNDQIQASDYLNKFSMLMRNILDSSRNEMLPIAKDMEALRLYVELEQLRFNNKFNYKDFTDPALVGGDYRVPSLLIQPYVENAIIHGLANSENEDLCLTVTASLENDRIKFIIQDNGIGRIQSSEYNRLNKPYHKSIGLKITEDRINLYKCGYETDGSIKITDLYDEYNNPTGTKVEITIKAI